MIEISEIKKKQLIISHHFARFGSPKNENLTCVFSNFARIWYGFATQIIYNIYPNSFFNAFSLVFLGIPMYFKRKS